MSYTINTARSREVAERLRRVLPGGDTRSVTYYPPYPLTLVRGEGCRVWDADGNSFIDLLNNYTAVEAFATLPGRNGYQTSMRMMPTLTPRQQRGH